MSTDYEAGTVAVATVRGRAGVRVMRSADDDGWGWVTADKVETWRVHENRLVHDIRPLVVLDPRDLLEEASSDPAEEVARSLRNLAKNDRHNDHGGYETTYRARIAANLADQIEAQTKPPRIPEPGLWGVVEARQINADNSRFWVHCPNGWRAATTLAGLSVSWNELADPVLTREGVES